VDGVARPGESGPARVALPRGSETVLLAEDEDEVRALTRESLRMSGYTVLEARHGAEALEVAARHPGPIPLLLTDVVMPQMGGGELAEALARLRPDTRVLYMSGYTNDNIVHQRVAAAGLALIEKPFTPADLARKVREVLDAPRGGP
jgi:CheY-like chemotaxis protein